MSGNRIPEHQLPTEMTLKQAVTAAYGHQMADVESDLRRDLPVLIECDKELTPFLFMDLRERLKAAGIQSVILDGRPRTAESAPGATFVTTVLSQLQDAVRGAVERRVVVLPHLDLLTSSQGGLTSEAREVIPLLYENPELVWLGFRDPSFPLPDVIENLFPRHYSLVGVSRDRLPQLVCQAEARKLGRGLIPSQLYKFVSGMNAVRLRRLLSSLDGIDYPDDPAPVLRRIRQVTRAGDLEIPNVDLQSDIGGYAQTKHRLQAEIIDFVARRDVLEDSSEIERIESLIPRGLIFWGPPGTGKTLFAKAMATAMGAAVTIVSGPELKSRWVGESEARLRQVFQQARRSAPAVIVFDELDSFTSARGTYTGSGVEHSMVNQLLTEMDGFRREELVFVVGTTNLVESLDAALLRPGRFEFLIEVPYPGDADRAEILGLWNDRLSLQMSEEALDVLVARTAGPIHGAAGGPRFSGDHLNAICRAIARHRIRIEVSGPTTAELATHVLAQWMEYVGGRRTTTS